jgi:hypothetical protein
MHSLLTLNLYNTCFLETKRVEEGYFFQIRSLNIVFFYFCSYKHISKTFISIFVMTKSSRNINSPFFTLNHIANQFSGEYKYKRPKFITSDFITNSYHSFIFRIHLNDRCHKCILNN